MEGLKGYQAYLYLFSLGFAPADSGGGLFFWGLYFHGMLFCTLFVFTLTAPTQHLPHACMLSLPATFGGKWRLRNLHTEKHMPAG